MSVAINTALALQWRRGHFLNELRYKGNKEAVTIFFDTWINLLVNIASVRYDPWRFLLGSSHQHFNATQSPAISFYRMKCLFLNTVFHLNSINIHCNYGLPLIWYIIFSLLSIVLEPRSKFWKQFRIAVDVRRRLSSPFDFGKTLSHRLWLSSKPLQHMISYIVLFNNTGTAG